MNSSQQSIMEFNRRTPFLFFLIFSIHFSLISRASSVAPIDTEWSQLDTKHFHIIFDKKQHDLGLYYSQVAEQAYSNLSSVFSILPDKITLVVSDTTDSANGNATVFPYPLIFVYPVQVGTQDSLSEAGEWAKELITHELTHIAQLYPYSSTGYEIARSIFGSIISPNLLTPLWWKEGMAVEMETQFSHQGRTRSYLQDAQVRSYVTNNALSKYTLAQANEVLITWPYGNRPYFFGSMIMSQISKSSNATALGEITLDQSGRPPYFINTPVKNILGYSYSEIYKQAQSDYKANSEKQIAELQKLPLSQPEKINVEWLQSKTIQFSEAHDLIATIATNDMKTRLEIYQINKDSNTQTRLDIKNAPTGTIGLFSFHPTQRKIIFSKTHDISLTQNYSDLFIYDIDEGKTTDLTESLRARDPIYSPSGEFALFIDSADGVTELKQIEISTKKIISIIKTDYQSRINSYAYVSPSEILYTERNKVGDQALYTIDLSQLSPTLIAAPKQIRYIKYKNELLYFTSTENEVQNVYSAKIDGPKLTNVKPITHLMTGSLSFDVDSRNRKVYATLIGENGPYAATVPFIEDGSKLPKITNEILERYKIRADLPYDATTTPGEYSSWNYIYPHYWIPFISSNVTSNGVLYQAITSAADPLGLHSYAAQLNYDSFSQKVGYLFSYTNTQLSIPWNASAFQTQQLFGLTNYVRKSTYSISLFPDTFSLSEDIQLSLGAMAPQTEYFNVSTNHLGGFIQLTVNNIEQKPQHFYPMTGYSLIAKYSSLDDQNSQVNPIYGDYSQALMSFTSYNHLFFPKDHTLMVKLDGLYTFEDVSNIFGTSNLSLPSVAESMPLFMVRGYQAGQFFGTQMVALNVEYRFPVIDISDGGSTTPFFAKYVTAGIVADALAVKGRGLDKDDVAQNLKLDEQIYSAGVEGRLSTTAGYILPLHFIAGVYFPMSKKFSLENYVTALNIQIGGF